MKRKTRSKGSRDWTVRNPLAPNGCATASGARKSARRSIPVTLAVLNKRFEAVTTKMANTLLRTGRSGVLNLARDFSTSVVTRECEAPDRR